MNERYTVFLDGNPAGDKEKVFDAVKQAEETIRSLDPSKT